MRCTSLYHNSGAPQNNLIEKRRGPNFPIGALHNERKRGHFVERILC